MPDDARLFIEVIVTIVLCFVGTVKGTSFPPWTLVRSFSWLNKEPQPVQWSLCMVRRGLRAPGLKCGALGLQHFTPGFHLADLAIISILVREKNEEELLVGRNIHLTALYNKTVTL